MNKHGFTLLEVTLFFAVSGLLALVAFAGLGPRLRNVRFTDAVRSLESTTQRQLSDFKAGSNLRSANISCSQTGAGLPLQLRSDATLQTAGSSEDCIINGRLAILGQESAMFYPVVSARKAASSCTADPTFGKLFCHNPTVLAYSGSVTEIFYRNGATAQSDSIGLLYLQDPNGTDTQLMQFTDPSKAPANGNTYPVLEVDILTLSPPPSICIGLSGRRASLEYNNSSLRPKIMFEGC